MYRIMVVDDEEYIAEGICSYLESLEEYDLDVYKAFSAKEVLDQFVRARFDIIITDIDMPEMNGLELAEQIVEFWPSCKVIFLTGYDKFEYAQKAIKNNAVDYVLKIDGLEAVKIALGKAIHMIETQTASLSILHEELGQANAANKLLQRKYLADMIMDHEMPAKEMFLRFKIPFSLEAKVLMMVGRMNDFVLKRSEYEAKGEIITGIIEQMMDDKITIMLLCIDKGWYLWLIQPNHHGNTQSPEQRLITYIVGMMEMIQEICESKHGIMISFALNHQAVGWESLKAEYDALKKRLQGWKDDDIPLIDVGSCNKTVYNNILPRLIKQLQLDLDEGRSDDFVKTLDSIIETICSTQNIKNTEVLEYYLVVLQMLVATANKYGLTFSVSGLDSVLEASAPKVYAKAFERLKRFAQEIFTKVEYSLDVNTEQIIKKVDKYIIDNYDNDISLINISEYVHLNPAYLSRLYKKQTGRTISTMIKSVRMEHAKQLLASTDLSVSDISGMVGYNSPAYFANIFRKETGITPQDFRKGLEKTNYYMQR